MPGSLLALQNRSGKNLALHSYWDTTLTNGCSWVAEWTGVKLQDSRSSCLFKVPEIPKEDLTVPTAGPQPLLCLLEWGFCKGQLTLNTK